MKQQLEKPSNLLLKLSRHLFSDAVEQEKFVNAIAHPKPFNPCILWSQPKPADTVFVVESPISWQPEFVDRLCLDTSSNERPGQHPLHQQGYFYCLDFSSVFAASTLLAISQPVNLVFDMCASPGGKSLFAWKALQPQLLISNEVIGKRTAALISNLKRCQVKPAIALSLDSKVLAELIPQTAQVVIVDAPCSGQSLLVKGGKAPGCFHPVNINKNANRQKRIIANSAQLVAPQGYLAYMTCTYSSEENEQVSEWFLSRFPEFKPVEVPHLADYQSHLVTIPCYRLWPQLGLGAGAFTALFQNTTEGQSNSLSTLLERPGLTYL